jgi:MYXO-CTERM domain-containing protein
MAADSQFDSPSPAAIGFTQYFGGQTMGPWQVLGVDILLLSSEHSEGSGPALYFNAHSGDAAIDLTGDGNSGPTDGVSQAITTTAGQTYKVSFWVGNQSGTGSFGQFYTLPSTVDFQVDGGARNAFTNANAIANGIQWTQFETTFTATSDSTTIAFMNGTLVGDHYAGLDDVSVSPAPEPAAWAVMLLGLFGAGTAVRRSRRQPETSVA